MWDHWVAYLSFLVGCCVLPLVFIGFAIFLWQHQIKEKKEIRKSHELSDSFVMPITEEVDKIRRQLKQAEKAFGDVGEIPPPDLFLQIAAGSNAWKNELDQRIIKKEEYRKRIRYWGLFTLLMVLFWPWIGVVFWLILPFGNYIALSIGFLTASFLLICLIGFVNSLLTPPPYKPGWLWAIGLLVGPMFGWALIFLINDKSLSDGLFLDYKQLTTLYLGVIFASGSVWALLVFVGGKDHADWHGRGTYSYDYSMFGLLLFPFVFFPSLIMLENPIITEPGILEWGFVVFVIKIFALQGLILGCNFGVYVFNLNGYEC